MANDYEVHSFYISVTPIYIYIYIYIYRLLFVKIKSHIRHIFWLKNKKIHLKACLNSNSFQEFIYTFTVRLFLTHDPVLRNTTE